MNRQTTTMLDHDDVDERSEEIYRAGPGLGRLGDRLAERQTPVPRRVLRPIADDDYDDRGDASFLRSQTRIRVRRGLIPETRWGRILAVLGLLLTAAALVAALLGVRSFLLHDQRFFIDSSAEVQINGNSHVSHSQLLSIFGEDIGRNLFRVPLAERRATLETLPWVEHATVMRLLPNRLRVNVVERTPVAFVRQGAQIGLADAYGVLLDLPAGDASNPKYDFPVLTGIAAADPLSTRSVRMKIYMQFMREIDSGGVKISDTLSEVDVSNPDDVKALIPDHSTEILVHFGDEDFLSRYQRYQQQLPSWRAQYPNLASVDMRYQNQVVLDMAPGSGSPQVSQPTQQNAAGQAAAAGQQVSVPATQQPGGFSVPAPPPESGSNAKKSAAVPLLAQPVSQPASQQVSKAANQQVSKTASQQVSKAASQQVSKTATAPLSMLAAKAAPAAAKKTTAKAAPVKAASAKPITAAASPSGAPAAALDYSTQHPLTKAFDVPANKRAASAKKAVAKAKKKPAAKSAPGVVKSKQAATTAQ